MKVAATIDLPNSGPSPAVGLSPSSGTIASFWVAILLPSTRIPLPPKKDRIEQFCTYGDLLMIGLDILAVPSWV